MTSSSFPRTIAWAAWLIASIFYAYQYVIRVMPNIMLSDIMLQFGIDEAAFGQFSGVYYIGYSIMHMPLGLMLDRFGPRKIMTGCILLTLVGLLPLLFASNWIYPVAGRFLIGLSSSAAILGVFKLIRMMFHEERFSNMLSLSVTVGLVGAIWGGGPLDYMRTVFGYQAVLQCLFVAGLLLALVTYLLVPDVKGDGQGTVKSDLKEVLTNRRVIWLCVSAGLMVGPLEGFADVWGNAFLKQVYGFEGTVAASLPSMIFIGMCFGAPLLSLAANKLGGHLVTIIAAGAVMAASFTALLTWQQTAGTVSLSFVLVGICCAYQILALYKATTYVREGVAGLTTAVANMIIMIFGYAFHTIIGNVIHSMGGAEVPQALIYGVAVIPLALCLGIIGFVFLFVTEKKSEKSVAVTVELEMEPGT